MADTLKRQELKALGDSFLCGGKNPEKEELSNLNKCTERTVRQ